MTTGNPQRAVLLTGASQRVLDEAVAGLRDLGCTAQTASDPAEHDAHVRQLANITG
jgi:hypothetical protein